MHADNLQLRSFLPTPSVAGKLILIRWLAARSAKVRDTLIMQVSIQELQELIEQLASETQSIHEPAAQNLVEAGAAAAVPLSQICNTPSRFSHRAAAVLKRIGADAVEPLVQVLQTGDCEAQVHAIIGLHLLNNKKALSPLVAALDSPFAQVRKAATRAL